MNILTRNFASTRPVQIATWTYKRYNLIVIFASTRPVQIATFASTQPSFRNVLCLHTPRADCNKKGITPGKDTNIFASTRPVQIATFMFFRPTSPAKLCLHTPRADCNRKEGTTMNKTILFASTRPVQIATDFDAKYHIQPVTLPPHAPCRLQQLLRGLACNISPLPPHAPCRLQRDNQRDRDAQEGSLPPHAPCRLQPCA